MLIEADERPIALGPRALRFEAGASHSLGVEGSGREAIGVILLCFVEKWLLSAAHSCEKRDWARSRVAVKRNGRVSVVVCKL